MSRASAAQAIFEADVAGLEGAEVVVANMDGSDPDSGTCWECGYAYKKKPIILFRTDFREAGDVPGSPFNLKLSASAAKVILALARSRSSPDASRPRWRSCRWASLHLQSEI